MNVIKPAIWKRVLKSNFSQSVFVAIVSSFIIKIIEKHLDENLMKSLFQSYFIELWPIWCGIGLALLYFIIRRIIQIDSFLRKGLAFNDKLNEIDIERRKLLTQVNNFYNRFERKLDNVHTELSKRLDEIEKQ